MSASDVDVDSDELDKRVTEWLEEKIIVAFAAQRTAYESAEATIKARNEYWYGGKGATGRLQNVSDIFLQNLTTRLCELADTQVALTTSLQQYAASLHGLADAYRQTDNLIADRFTNINRGFDEGV
ncbi:hypothetical protein ALI144C_08710 [Actinosynnema sp. ALI-1.44]|uniref:hypothetical protein n=1 Tax=Actinosynnema sp. ALI-1.44 TaxID=1933779 RepID=UPI00097C9254|nr:hypothetical protein [Actinosynnema sp. ALI-1.44]ONI87466.1 hypothetical protein ALI144C_08710 [Actinosynnema sp. ALI-1.44]